MPANNTIEGQKPRRKRILPLQALRPCFSIPIVVHHATGDDIFQCIGSCGVAFFFILSGFVLSLGYGKKIDAGTYSTKAFYMRQLSKVYPMHLAMMLIFLVLNMRLGVFASADQLITNTLLLQSWIPDRAIHFALNSPSWFLCAILFCYLSFKTLYNIIYRMKESSLIAMTLIVIAFYPIIALVIPHHLSNEILFINPLFRLLDFSLGIIVYRLYCSRRTEGLKQWCSSASILKVGMLEALPFIMLAILNTFYLSMPFGLQHAWPYWFIIPLLLIIFVATDERPGFLGRLLHTRPMVWLGGISFEIYITHMFTIRMVQSVLPMLSVPVQVCVIVPCVILVAYLVQRFIVNPCFALAQRTIL